MSEITPEGLKKIGFYEEKDRQGKVSYVGWGVSITFGKKKGQIFGYPHLPLERLINAIRKLD